MPKEEFPVEEEGAKEELKQLKIQLHVFKGVFPVYPVGGEDGFTKEEAEELKQINKKRLEEKIKELESGLSEEEKAEIEEAVDKHFKKELKEIKKISKIK